MGKGTRKNGKHSLRRPWFEEVNSRGFQDEVTVQGNSRKD